MEIETGKAIEVEAGKTYILQTDKNITYEQAMSVLKLFKDTTGSKAVLLIDGMRIAVDSEHDIRERIAKEIEAMWLNELDHPDWCNWLREGCDCPYQGAVNIARGLPSGVQK